MEASRKKGFFGRLMSYNKPCFNVLIGFIVTVIQGSVFPLFAVPLVKMLFIYSIYYNDLEKLREESNFYCLLLTIVALISLVAVTV